MAKKFRTPQKPKPRNPIARLMQTRDGRHLFGEKIEEAGRGRGSYSRKVKHKNQNED